jgi:protein SCO1
MAGGAMNSARTLVLLCLAGLLAACSAAPAARPPLDGASIGGPFTLTDQNGRTVKDSDFAGRYRIVYFGYTYCPDICPVDMQNISAAMKALDKSDPRIAARLQPIFITVDPARDTPDVLKQYASNFDSRLVALTGSDAAVAKAAEAYKVYYQKQPAPEGSDGYLVNHLRVTYLMSPDGKPVALLPADKSAAEVAAEIKRWVS